MNIIDILQFPKKKTNGLNPWYVILYRLCLYPIVLVFGIGFYISTLAFTLSPYSAEQFRKDYL